MTCRALLIGCVAPDLPGVEESVWAMAAFLRDVHGFAVDVLVGPATTVTAIHAAFLRLLRATRPCDAVLVYYAGHGTVFRLPPRGDRGEVRVDLIRPPEFGPPEFDEFRGLLGLELSQLLQAVAELTHNVTAILDCCHAADLIRPDDVGLDRPSTRQYIADVKEELARRAPDVMRSTDDFHEEGPRIVLVAASASGGQSFPDPERKILLFTDALMRALPTKESSGQLTWQEIVDAIRRHLRGLGYSQLPGVSGARFRFPFRTDVGGPGPGYFPARPGRSRVTIAAGTAASIREGQEFDLIGYGWGAERRGYQVGCAVAERVEADAATLRIVDHEDGAPLVLPRLLYARCLDDRKLPLAVDPLAAAALQPAATPADLFNNWRIDGERPIGHLRWNAAAQTIDVHDHDDELVARVAAPDPDARNRVEKALARVRRWWDLWRALDSGDLPALGGCFDTRWGLLRTDEGAVQPREEPLADGATVVAGGDPVFVRLENAGYMNLFARAYRIAADRTIHMWEDRQDPASVQVHESKHLGRESIGDARGQPLRWPDGVLPDAPPGSRVKEYTLVVVSDQRFAREAFPSDDPAAERPDVLRGAKRFAFVSIPYVLEHA